MAYQKLSPISLVSAIQKRIENGTNIRCLDHVGLNEKSPFYYAEIVRILPANTKTMFRDNYTVQIHCIAEVSPSSIGVYNMIQALQEAMSIDITLPDTFELVLQTDGGVQTIKEDETGEKHAVVNYYFMICYGFRCK